MDELPGTERDDGRTGECSGVRVGRNWVRGNWVVITQEARIRLQRET